MQSRYAMGDTSRILSPGLAVQAAVGADNHGCQIDVAGVVLSGTAQPRFGVAVVIGLLGETETRRHDRKCYLFPHRNFLSRVRDLRPISSD